MYKELKHHEHPISPADFLERINSTRPRDLALIKGQYSPDPAKSNRYFVYIMEGSGLKPQFACWIAETDFEEILALVRAGRKVFTGGCDAMYATAPKYAWVEKDDGLLLCRKNRLFARIGADGVRLFVNHPPKVIKADEISDIYLFLSDGWVESGVRLRLKNGENMEIAKNKEWSAVFDPTYDGIDLMCDTFWAIDLGRAVQKYLDVPLNMDKDLE